MKVLTLIFQTECFELFAENCVVLTWVLGHRDLWSILSSMWGWLMHKKIGKSGRSGYIWLLDSI